ncbi:hypothetical protein HCN51_31250 [Nonomuraea sp. FMUSA5-5]|uniref:Uncharacterized protein n=1 Tax=Nonomuraea composti TaxID=2720023 RepID=A0ABX1BGA9_9ACTN|nr:hypothetical protein [Nonomuraea sp. FMUSA5-5]NJP93868.1 hypothetical protein [Nonomuraea sp. FMUSA5-5]
MTGDEVYRRKAIQALTLDRTDFLARQDSYDTSRMSDQALEGSNDLTTWKRPTPPATRTLDWENLPSLGRRGVDAVMATGCDVTVAQHGEIAVDRQEPSASAATESGRTR